MQGLFAGLAIERSDEQGMKAGGGRSRAVSSPNPPAARIAKTSAQSARWSSSPPSRLRRHHPVDEKIDVNLHHVVGQAHEVVGVQIAQPSDWLAGDDDNGFDRRFAIRAQGMRQTAACSPRPQE